MKIAILDDSKTVLMELKHILKEFELKTFYDVGEFFDDVKINEYDVFLIDINMPKKNGLDVINEIKDYPHLKNSIFLILSTEIKPEYKQIAKKIGVRAFIKKPFDEKLALIIKRLKATK